MSYPKPLSEKSLNRLYMQAGLSTETCAVACLIEVGDIVIKVSCEKAHESER